MTAKEVQDLLRQHLDLGIEECLRAAKGKLHPDSSLNQDLHSYSHQYHAALKDYQKDWIQFDDYKQERTKVFHGLQHLIDAITPADLPPPETADPLADWPLSGATGFPDVPFLGFHRFEARHARVFYGRRQEIRRVLDLLRDYPGHILLLSGPTGAGKSSFLEAGLLPRLLHKGWAVETRRRNRERGLENDLRHGYEALRAATAAHKLLLLDQVEEMYTNPNEALPTESRDWASALRELWSGAQGPACRLLLSFRKEYAEDIRKLLEDEYDLPFKNLYLEPLAHQGVREAVAGDAERNRHYRLDIDPALPAAVAADLCPQPTDRPDDPGLRAPGTAPLLQMTLRKMWDLADHGQPQPAVPFDLSLYRQVGRKNLADMLDEQLNDLLLHLSPEPDAPVPTIGKQPDAGLWDAVRNGLALDVLRQFITKDLTATACSVTRLERDAYPHVPGFRRLIKALKDLFLLGEEPDEQQTRTRLTHDALAPLVYERCETSDKPAQLAWNLVQAKSRHAAPADGSADFSEADIAIIEAGRPYMQRIPPAVDARIQASIEQVEARRAELRDKNSRMFEAAAADACDKLERCEHAAALAALGNALRNSDVPLAQKTERLLHALCETAFFFSHTGRHNDAVRAALDMLAELSLPESAGAPLRHAMAAHETDPATVAAVLQAVDADFFANTLQPRYFPALTSVPAGSFVMGFVEGRDGDGFDDEKPHHPVQVNAFRMADAPVTFYQFSLYCAASGRNIASFRPSWGIQGEHPAVNTSWYDAAEYANWLSAHDGLTPYYRIDKAARDPNNQSQSDYLKWLVEPQPDAGGYRLPTEAEWEYAARGGEQGATRDAFLYAGGNDVDEVAWYWKNSGDRPIDDDRWDFERILQNNGRTHAVRGKKPNQFQLYDMSGNVYEWCFDWFGPYSEDAVTPESGVNRVIRGGSWDYAPRYCRAADRNYTSPGNRSYGIGFRLAASPQ